MDDLPYITCMSDEMPPYLTDKINAEAYPTVAPVTGMTIQADLYQTDSLDADTFTL